MQNRLSRDLPGIDFCAYAGQKRLHFLIVRALCGDFSTQAAFTRHPGAGGLFRTSVPGNYCLWADNKKILIFPAKSHAQKFMPDSFCKSAENTSERNALFRDDCLILRNHFYMAAAKQP